MSLNFIKWMIFVLVVVAKLFDLPLVTWLTFDSGLLVLGRL